MYIFKDDSYIAIQLFASDGEHMVIFALIWYKVWMMMMTQLNLNHSNWTFPLISTLVLVLNQIFVPYTLHFALVLRFLAFLKMRNILFFATFASSQYLSSFFFLALSQNTSSDHWFSHKIENWYHCFMHCFQHYFLITRKVQTLDQIFAFGDFMDNWKYIFI